MLRELQGTLCALQSTLTALGAVLEQALSTADAADDAGADTAAPAPRADDTAPRSRTSTPVRLPPVRPRARRNHLTAPEVAALLAGARLTTQGPRDHGLLLLCFLHGLRASELCDLRLSDVDLAGGSIAIRRLKKGFSTRHPLPDEAADALRAWLTARDRYPGAGQSDRLFLSRTGRPLSRQLLHHLIGRLGRQVNLPVGAHPHMLRHACGFALADRGIDTRLIQDYLGHRNIRHTVWYTASNAARFRGLWHRPVSCGCAVSPARAAWHG
ncbi:tyrosine-type recombinase/integrase [Serratia marcescens]|uniref:Tyrosine-type recombinase/integrase n=1 Tax=Serratia marcescens TaxID=615 RepID=A0A5C7BT65_SERMA|nr:tyrosine-type recombinase/integrase [Serratia marcescens]TXE55333.1 tyrosine-type recombinase/integrase [Serratia marcescens]